MVEYTSMMALLWVAVAVICARWTAVIWWDAIADYRWTEARELPHARVLTAQDQLMIHTILMSIQLIAIGLGIMAYFVPLTTEDGRIHVVRFVLVGGFILIELLLTLMSIWSRRNWRKILRMMESTNKRSTDLTMPVRESKSAAT